MQVKSMKSNGYSGGGFNKRAALSRRWSNESAMDATWGVVSARAVRLHLDNRILLYERKTVVFD